MYSWTDITGDEPQTVDAARLRKTLGAYPTGVCLVTTIGADGKREGMTINSFASVSLSPPLVLWSIRDDARSADVFINSPNFIISVLTASQQELAMHFSRPAADKFEKYEDEFTNGLGGCPRLSGCLASFECTTYSRYQEGDHTILVGRIQDFSGNAGQPLMFHAGQVGTAQEVAQRLAAQT
ncbi:MAG: flavin reductase family protein [Pseudomonadota bacterium]